MFNVIQGRLGHTVDAFAVIETDHVSLNYGSSENQTQEDSTPSDTSRKHPNDDAVLYQEKLRVRNRVARFFDTLPKYAESTISHEQALHTEEARQVIHGAWRAHHSEKLWSVLDREVEVDFAFEDVNPANIDHFITGMCKLHPEFKSTHMKHLLCLKFAKHAEKNGYNSSKDTAYNSRRVYSNVHNLILFGGMIPTEKQMESCRNMLSVTGILESIEDLVVTNDIYVISIRDALSPWKSLNTVGTPKARAFHASAILYLDFATPVLCVTGGFGAKRQLMDMTLYLLCLIQKKKGLSWVTLHTEGKMPSKRYGHTMGQVGPWLTLFGGTDGQQLFNDLWILNVCDGAMAYKPMKTTNVWCRVDIVGLVPPPRCFHACVKVGIEASNPIIIYGGVTADSTSRAYTLKLDKYGEFRWNVLPITIRGPNECRAFHSMVFADGQLVITGGEDFRVLNPTIHKCLVYSVQTKEFQYADEAVPLTGHRSIVINGVIHHFGGLRSIGSSVFLEPIGSPKGIRDALEVRNALEQYYLRELAKETDVYPKGRQGSPIERRPSESDTAIHSEKSSSRSRGESQGGKKTTQPVEEVVESRNTGRPKRSAAEKCVQHIGEEVAKILAKEKEKANANAAKNA